VKETWIEQFITNLPLSRVVFGAKSKVEWTRYFW